MIIGLRNGDAFEVVETRAEMDAWLREHVGQSMWLPLTQKVGEQRRTLEVRWDAIEWRRDK